MDLTTIKARIAAEAARIKKLGTASRIEARNNYIAAKILIRMIEQKDVSPADIGFLKSQSIDFAKVLALIGLAAVPGSSVAMILLAEAGRKYGFSIFPNTRIEPPKDV